MESDYTAAQELAAIAFLFSVGALTGILISKKSYRELQSEQIKLKDEVQERKMLQGMKDEFMSSVAHEFKTPITSIISLSPLLLEGKLGPLEQKQKEAVDIIHMSAVRLLADLNNFLTFYRMHYAGLDIQKEENDINIMIRDEALLQRPTVEKKGLELKKELADIPKVMCDKKWIAHVLSNLIGNSIKYTKEGSITVTTGMQGKSVVVSVSDTGDGLPEEDLKKIFDEFYRVKRNVGEGTGLGLTTCKRIIEAHDGKIWAESPGPDRGTTIFFILPVN